MCPLYHLCAVKLNLNGHHYKGKFYFHPKKAEVKKALPEPGGRGSGLSDLAQWHSAEFSIIGVLTHDIQAIRAHVTLRFIFCIRSKFAYKFLWRIGYSGWHRI